MKERHLKVYETSGCGPIVPQIRLQGNWLSEIGYTAGEKIIVSHKDGKLIIELASAASVSES